MNNEERLASLKLNEAEQLGKSKSNYSSEAAVNRFFKALSGGK